MGDVLMFLARFSTLRWGYHYILSFYAAGKSLEISRISIFEAATVCATDFINLQASLLTEG